ncbi:class IV adenylate cyclase [Candidatus Woesearchaeota archaeon]|nr:class IV adenylate cyclase [Candidatus Woesearchaeota archaeon]
MQEMEVKVIDINKEEIIKKLLELGAEKVFEGDIQASSYDFEDNRLAKDHAFIRLRKKGDKTFLTYKKKINQDYAKVMQELETEVKDFDEMQKILLAAGLKAAKDLDRKKRTSFQIDNILFEIDEHENVPAYMEIEAPTLDLINEYVEKLGLDKEKVKTWTGKELLEHYGIKVDFMRV